MTKTLAVAIALVAVGSLSVVGARSNPTANVASPAEVAVLTGVLGDGQTIPLPTYQDGTQALESECRWTVSPHDLVLGTNPPYAWHCSADTRTVSVYCCNVNNCVPSDPTFSHGSANYMIIAVRGPGLPTRIRGTSWGALKSSYR